MDMLKLSGVAIGAAVMALLLRRMKPEISLATSMAGGLLVAALVLPRLTEVVQGIAAIARMGGLADSYITHLLRVCGVSLLADFSAQTCHDAGEGGLALKVELAGRIVLMAMALPFMQALLQQILSLSP